MARALSGLYAEKSPSNRLSGLAMRYSNAHRETVKRLHDGVKNNSFLTEHSELFASIRTGKPINNGNYMAKSTLMAIMGRMATYTGQVITWEQTMDSTEDLSPASYDWNAQPPASIVAIPGLTKL